MVAIKNKKLNILICPICGAIVGKRITALEEHCLERHGTLLKDLWLNLYPQSNLCSCGCGSETRWISWSRGYSKFVIGHNGNLDSSYEKSVANSIKQKRSSALSGQRSWCSGLTKEDDDRVLKRSTATSLGMSRAYAEGKWKPWNKGKKVETRKYIRKYTNLRLEDIVLELKNNIWLKLEHAENFKNHNIPSLWVQCRICEYHDKVNYIVAKSDKCPKCCTDQSVKHNFIEWIKSSGILFVENVKGIIGKQTLELYFPMNNLAIEFYLNKNDSSLYRKLKVEACENVGINLIQINEDDWKIDSNDIKEKISFYMQDHPTRSVP